MNILNYFLDFFKKSPDENGMGALKEDVDDYRNISLGSFQKPVGVINVTDVRGFEDLIIKLNFWFNQLGLPACVPHAITKLKMLYTLKKTGKFVLYTPRWGYKNCKIRDGYPGSGTYPRIGAISAVNDGFLTEDDLPNNTSLSERDYLNFIVTDEMRAKAKDEVMAGFAFVEPNIQAIKEAIYQNGAVCGANRVSFWNRLPLPTASNGTGHYTLWYRVENVGLDYKIYIDNSWGKGWLAKILNWMFPGRGYFLWSEHKDSVYDIIAFTDVPQEILEKAKAMPYKFTKNLSLGDSDIQVKELQKMLNTSGCTVTESGSGSRGNETMYFGFATKNALAKWQTLNGLPRTGFFGPLSIEFANRRIYKNMITKWAEAIQEFEGWKIGSRSYRNKNPGNIRYYGMYAKMAVGKDDKDFCIFDSYEKGFDALQTLLIRASTGLSTVYSPKDTLLEFYKKYAPSTDGNYPEQYAAHVAKRLGVSVDTKIGTLNN